MSPNSHIKNLCDESLNDLFSKENWEKIQNKKKIKNNSDPLYTDIESVINYHKNKLRTNYFYIYL